MSNGHARQRGLTIVEIMVTLAVAAVLIGLALPAFNGFLAQRALSSQTNALIVAVQYARSEATRRNTAVSVQAADASDNANEWGLGGWCVVVGDPGNCPADDTVRLRSFPASTRSTLDATVSTLTFNARGLLVGVAGDLTFNLCDNDDDIDPGRAIRISPIGRVSAIELDCHP
jgi:type IV fimbrial biogenesis protein FimT